MPKTVGPVLRTDLSLVEVAVLLLAGVALHHPVVVWRKLHQQPGVQGVMGHHHHHQQQQGMQEGLHRQEGHLQNSVYVILVLLALCILFFLNQFIITAQSSIKLTNKMKIVMAVIMMLWNSISNP
jgi:4-amino-4-deoxy-L-arabinose transferase-like glycosyltransferase